MTISAAVGRYGERVAAAHLVGLGMEVLARNWRFGRLGEIDIVAADGDCLVICEVKTRRGDAFGGGLAALTHVKVARLRRLAGAWLAAAGEEQPPRHWRAVRIDVVVVRPSVRGAAEVEHVRGIG